MWDYWGRTLLNISSTSFVNSEKGLPDFKPSPTLDILVNTSASELTATDVRL